MANLSSALMRAIGNEIIPAGESALANSATSALSEIGSKLGAGLATKAVSRNIPVAAGKSLAQAISVGKPEMVDIYRGISAKSDDDLVGYLRQMLDKNVKPTTYSGGSMQGEGYNFSTGRDVAEYFANRRPQQESRAVLHTRVPKDRFIGQNKQNGNRLVDFQLRAESRGIPYENGASARQAEKDMQRYFDRNGLLGIKSPSGETYVINQNDDAWLNNLDVFSASKGRGTRIEPDDSLLSTLRSILPSNKNTQTAVSRIRDNWAGPNDIESMLDGKFLETNDNYFPSTFSQGALGRATYGPEQPIDQRKVAGLVRAIKNNEDIAPIAGFKTDDGLIDIYDGHHRLAAYQKAGKMPRVKLFTEDTKSQAYDYADEWARNAGKEVEQYIGKSSNDLPMSINENGGVSYDLSSLNGENMMQSKIELTPEQAEFFKDSKIRDANGNLVPVYHSSPNQFTEFDDSKLGQNTMYDNTAFGHFVTTDKDFSSRFRDINNTGKDGYTMELYANVKKPITHPYQAGYKYEGKELDDIVENYLKAIEAEDYLDELKKYAAEEGQTIYDQYMNDVFFSGDSPFEVADTERKMLQDKGYDAVELVEGLKSDLIDGWDKNDNTPISSYAVFNGNSLKDIRNLKPTSNPDIRLSKGGESLTDIGNRLKAMNKSREMSSDIRTIGSKDVAKIDENTIPKGYKDMVEYINEDPTSLYKKLVGVEPEDATFPEKIAKWLEDEGYDVSKNVVDNMRMVRRAYAEQLLEKMNLEGGYAPRTFLETRSMLEKDNPGKGLGPRTYTISAEDGQIYQTNAAKLDREYSDRLGIGRSHTPMADKVLSNDASGYYMTGGIGLDEHYATGESGVSTVAHERMHAWQDAVDGDWDKRFIKARDELRNELADHYHSRDQIKKDHPRGDVGYYARDIEQEARMLQSYLDNEGFTNTWKKQTGKVEWGDEIKPAFDKFYKKLRSLSKAGVALPAIALLFGLNTNGGEKDSKKA